MNKEYKIHLVAPPEYGVLKTAIEKISEEEVTVTGWDYSFSALAHWANAQRDIIPDIVLMFDTAEYPKVDVNTAQKLYYRGLIDCIKQARLKVETRYIIILSAEKEENAELLNELMKLDIHDFHFANGNFTFNDVKHWIFTQPRSLVENQRYLISGQASGDGTKIVEKIVEKEVVKKVVEEKVIERVETYNFKRLVITVCGEAEFACELACMIAGIKKDYRVMVIDASMDNPCVCHYLKLPIGVYETLAGKKVFKDYGVNIALNATKDNSLTLDVIKAASVSRKDMPNLLLLTGCYRDSENQEENLSSLIELCYRSFEVTIVITDSRPNDFSLTSIKESDFCIIPVKPDNVHIEGCTRLVNILVDECNVPIYKVEVVIWEYNEKFHLIGEYQIQKHYQQCYIGKVSYCAKRAILRNSLPLFAKRMLKSVFYRAFLDEYLDILKHFNIVEERKKSWRGGEWLKKIQLLRRGKAWHNGNRSRTT